MKAWSLGRRITALSAAVAVTLGLIAITAALTAADNRATTQHLLNDITPALVHAEQLQSALLRQQSSVRTFALTGRDDDLEVYRDAVRLEREVVDRLEALLADEPSLRQQARDSGAAVARYRAEIAEPLIAATQATGTDAQRAMPNDRSRTIFQAASGQITALAGGLAERRDGLDESVNDANTALVILLVGALIIVILAGIALSYLLRRLVIRPVTELAGEVRRVARGEYDHEISAISGGPRELQRLARDVDAMRVHITRDLSTVRTARTEIEAANRMLEEQADELTRSNRDLEQFAYVASHDLQEPLRKVASFCQLLQRRYAGQLDERADQYIEFAVDGAQRMQRLINDLLAFSRIGRITGGFTDLDLNKVAADAAAQYESLRDEIGAEIAIEDLPVVRGEEPLLGALIANLVGNALKFRHPERLPHIRISARQVGDEWEISCEDNGIGIEPEYAEKVFVIFQRLHAKETYPGTGIGLAIAKKIVEYHGGRIWVDPDHRPGTLIRFTIPVSTPEATQHAAGEPDSSVAEEINA
jgi:signal transduction histidine kinase